MITLRPFQEAPSESALSVFRYLAGQLPTLSNAAERAAAVAQNGAVLLHAPTGAGKTVMAGHIAETLSKEHKVVWFWFTPFKALVEQSEQSLRSKFPGLRTRRLADDRDPQKTKAGDVWVTTWQLVAASNTDGRRVRNDREDNPSVDTLMTQLRKRGFMVGVIVDESHHGFRKGTQAFDFYKEVIKPDFTLLVTATPDDNEVEAFPKDAGFRQMPRILIPRSHAVEAGLVKPGLRSIVLIAKPGQENLVDFETTAIREATKTHNGIKAELARLGIPLVPLMLVQLDSTAGSKDRVKKKLLAAGFTDSQVVVHLDKEPNEALLKTIAYDTSKEVLVFKVAVALGFDAPRAWTLVSMRGIVDADFGTQIVGRLMRVHELCQGRVMPEALQHAYVFLADLEKQQGLELAADKLNRVKASLASVASSSVVVQIGGEGQLQVIRNGQPELIADETTRPALEALKTSDVGTTAEGDAGLATPETGGQAWFGVFDALDHSAETEGQAAGSDVARDVPIVAAAHRYPIREGIPTRLRKERAKPNTDGLDEAIVAHVNWSADILIDGLRRAVEVLRLEKGLFANAVQEGSRQQIQAALDRQATEESAEQLIFNLGNAGLVSSPQRLDELLRLRVANELRRMGRAEADNADEVEYTLAMVLVQNRHLLKQAQRRAVAGFVEAVDTEPLPPVLVAASDLPQSHGNVYGRMPEGMNLWEIAFAEWLDSDAASVVNWWHRNPTTGGSAVIVVLPDGLRFFPDFIISVKGRSKTDGILLVDTKRGINDDLNAVPKTVVEHREYGRAMILKKDGRRWMTIRYNEAQDKNVEDQVLHADLLAHFV